MEYTFTSPKQSNRSSASNSESHSLQRLPKERQESAMKRNALKYITSPRKRSRKFRDYCTDDYCTGCDKGSRQYNSDCYKHMLECISYRVEERLHRDNLPFHTASLIQAFLKNPQAYFESNTFGVMQIPRLLMENAMENPSPYHKEQRWRMKHIAPLPLLFDKLLKCRPDSATLPLPLGAGPSGLETPLPSGFSLPPRRIHFSKWLKQIQTRVFGTTSKIMYCYC